MYVDAERGRAEPQRLVEVLVCLEELLEVDEADGDVEANRRMIPVRERFAILRECLRVVKLDELSVALFEEAKCDRLFLGGDANRPRLRLCGCGGWRVGRRRICGCLRASDRCGEADDQEGDASYGHWVGQSLRHEVHPSLMSHLKSPHRDAHAPQSVPQLRQFSCPVQTPSPRDAPHAGAI